jgi:hypothetical protein
MSPWGTGKRLSVKPAAPNGRVVLGVQPLEGTAVGQRWV